MLEDVTVEEMGKLSPQTNKIEGIEVTMHFRGKEEVWINAKDLAGRLEEDGETSEFVLDQQSRVKLVLSVYAAAIQKPGSFWFLVAEEIHKKVKEENSRN